MHVTSHLAPFSNKFAHFCSEVMLIVHYRRSGVMPFISLWERSYLKEPNICSIDWSYWYRLLEVWYSCFSAVPSRYVLQTFFMFIPSFCSFQNLLYELWSILSTDFRSNYVVLLLPNLIVNDSIIEFIWLLFQNKYLSDADYLPSIISVLEFCNFFMIIEFSFLIIIAISRDFAIVLQQTCFQIQFHRTLWNILHHLVHAMVFIL